MNASWITAKQTKFTAYVIVYGAIVVAALGLVNFLANRYNKSLDTTANKQYSLSEQTEKVVGELKTDVRVTYFDQQGRFAAARDLLDRYDNLSPRLSVNYVDPDKDPQAAREMGVANYGAIYVAANGKREEASSLSEEQITGALIRALKEGQSTICALTGSGEHSLDDSGRRGYSQVKETAERYNYLIKTISLIESADVPADCTVLVAGGPQFDYSEPAANSLKTFVESGGGLLVMLTPPLQVGQDRIADNQALAGVLDGWGVSVRRDVVVEPSLVGRLAGYGSYMPVVQNYGSHAIVRSLVGVATAFPMSRSLDTTSKENVQVDVLLRTSDSSFSTKDMSLPNDPPSDQNGPLAIAAAGTHGAGGEMEGRFVVVGSSDWASNSALGVAPGNRDLLMNMLNWLSSDEDLISIRPKDPENRPLSMTGAQMRTLFLTSVVFLPLIILGAGVGVWWKRR
jgi:ABC-type uncharacterized transport system involved in gliding motility auxiliary subunit